MKELNNEANLPVTVEEQENVPERVASTELETGHEKYYESEEEALKAISVDVSDEVEPDEYYLAVSRRIRIARYLVLLMIVCLSLVMLTLYSSVINLTGIKEFFFSFGGDVTDYSPDTVIYAGTEEYPQIEVFKNHVAALSDDAFVLYKPNGEVHLAKKLSFSDPVVTFSSRYTLIYDFLGTEMTMLNSVDVINAYEVENGIYSADVSDSGEVAVLTHDVSTPSVVVVYDENFEEALRWTSSDKYTSAVELIDGKDRIAICSFNSQVGKMECYISLFDLVTGETVNSIVVTGTVALSVEETASGFVAVCTDRILFFDGDGAQTHSVDLERYGTGVGNADVCPNYVAVTVSVSDNADGSKVVVFDTSGNPVYEGFCNYSVSAFKCHGDKLYYVMHGELFKVDLKTGEFENQKLDKEYTLISVMDDGGIVLSSQYDTVIIK